MIDLEDIKKFAQNRKEIESDAKSGDADSQYKLGCMYYAGCEIKQDYKKAFDLFMKAAEQGYPAAQHQLGDMYSDGIGIEKDNKKAAEWWLKAKEWIIEQNKGNTELLEALKNLEKAYNEDEDSKEADKQ